MTQKGENMVVSRIDRVNHRFRARLDGLMNYQNLKTDSDVAELLGCSLKTVTNMRNSPLSVSSRWTLLIEDYYEEAKKKYEY